MARRYIDAHVHITPAYKLGTKNERYGTECMPYGYLKMGDAGFYTMPPYIHDSQFTADTLVHCMDCYGVEKSVILQSLMSPQNQAVADAVQKYPDRLAGAMVLEPIAGWEDEMDHWYQQGLHSIKYEMRAYTSEQCYPDITYTDPRMIAMFQKAGSKGMTVTIDPAPVNFPVYAPEKLYEAAVKCPDTRFVLCHMAYPMPIDTPERYAKWQQMLKVASLKNCWLDISAMPDFFDAEGWPYPTALKLLEQAKKMAGADKLIWGTDITGTLNRATYPQMQKQYEHAACLNDEELDMLYYANAKDAYQL